MRRAALLGAALGLLALAGPAARAIPRDDVLVHARAFAYHPWRCATANLTASCNTSYQSIYTPGDYVGLPYDWGGYMSLFEFDQQIAQGYGAGSYPADGELDCTAGLDCSGFVSKCWDTGHYGTSTMDQISTVIDQSAILPGDAFNQAGYHVILYSHTLASGEPIYYESAGANVHITANGGWSHVSGFTPRRFNGITGTTAGTPLGTPDNPIVVGAFPYTDTRDTRQAASDVLDGCAADPTKRESGPEYVYRVTLTQPGTLTAAVADDVSTDIDVHLYGSMNTSDCIARHDTTLSRALDCGTWYVVADTFVSAGGTAYPGPYTLSLTFTPSGAACGTGTAPPVYTPSGGPGQVCSYPGHEELPECNPNLGADTCIYSSGGAFPSFCSRPCASVADCTAFPGGCCEEISAGELYCMIAAQCGTSADGGTSPHDGGPVTHTDAAAASDGAPATGDAAAGDAATTADGAAPADDAGAAGGDAAPGGGGGGCNCRASGARAPGGLAMLLLGPVAFLRRRRP
ncbi:MAG TPA: hypothetical protein VGQ83_08915 [Polyangia bacterium]|jgi:MYXO-CTERM domain-containing protein